MKPVSRVAFALSAFLLVAAAVYWLTAYEDQGATYLLITGVAFGYVGLVARGAARHAERADPEVQPTAVEEQEAEEEQVLPTAWPLAFSLGAILLVLAVVVARWIVILAVIAFAAAALGWMRDVRQQHAGADAGHGGHAVGPTTADGRPAREPAGRSVDRPDADAE